MALEHLTFILLPAFPHRATFVPVPRPLARPERALPPRVQWDSEDLLLPLCAHPMESGPLREHVQVRMGLGQDEWSADASNHQPRCGMAVTSLVFALDCSPHPMATLITI